MSDYEHDPSEFNDFPKCPKCGAEDNDWWDGIPKGMRDGSTWQARCGDCGPYMVLMCVSTSFATSEINGEKSK